MSFTGIGRTNYVRVTDVDALTEAVEPFARVVTNADGKVALLDTNEGEGWTFTVYDEETDDYIEHDPVGTIAEYLHDGEVMVMTEAGFDKYRFATGWALAFNNRGETRRVSLNDIYDLAAELGPNVTDASY